MTVIRVIDKVGAATLTSLHYDLHDKESCDST
jgi:hypothetical protein